MCKYEEQCDNWDFRMELATKNMNILADALEVADTPQTDCNGCEHWKCIAHEWQCETVKCQKIPQTDCGWK